MANPRRQRNYRRAQSRRHLRKNQAQEDRLPSEEFSKKDFTRMEAQATKLIERNRRLMEDRSRPDGNVTNLRELTTNSMYVY